MMMMKTLERLSLISIAAIIMVTIITINNNNEADAYLCPLDEIEQHANNINSNLLMWNSLGAQAETQKLLDLIQQAKADKLAEEQQDLRHYQ